MALDALPDTLAPFAAQSKPPVFRIRMDKDSTAQQFITVMDALKTQRLTKITFDTQASTQ